MRAVAADSIWILVYVTWYYAWTGLSTCIVIFLSVLFLARHVSFIKKLPSFKIYYHSIFFSLLHSKSRVLSILFLWNGSGCLSTHHHLFQWQLVMDFKFIIFIDWISSLRVIFIIANRILFFKMIQIIIFPASRFGYSFHSYTACPTLINDSVSEPGTLIEIIRWEYLLTIIYILPILDSFLSAILEILRVVDEMCLKLVLNEVGTVGVRLIFSIIILGDQWSWYWGLSLVIINIINLTLMHSIIY